MALEQAGVQLIAQGASAFASDLASSEKAVGSFVKATGGAEKSVGGFGQVAIGMARRAGGAIVDFGLKAAGAIADFAGQSLDMAGDYEQSMNVLQAQSGATNAEMDKVRDTAKALGADLELPAVSAATAGEAMLELSKGGLTVDESMAAAKGTLMLAAAAQTDVATAANITTGALKTFNLQGDKASYIADLLANAANQSRASITDLGAGFQQAGFRMQSAGQGADDLAASLAILTNNGLSGSDAGTALQNAIARLQGPTDKAQKLMKDLGINVYDANGKMLPMRDIIGVLNSKLGGMTQQQRNAVLQTIFLSDGMKAMIPLMAAGADGFDKMKDAVNKGGSARELAAAQMKGIKGAAEGLQSQLQTLALEGLEPLLPLFAEGLKRAAAFVGGFVGKVGPAVKEIIRFVGEAGDVFQAVFVPAVSAAGAALLLYALKSIPLVITSLPGMIAQIAASTAAFGAQALAAAAAIAPYALVAAAVAGVVVAYKDFDDKIKTATQDLLNSRQWWLDSATALDTYSNSSADVQEKLSAHAATIRELRSEIQGEIESLGRRMAAGMVSEDQYNSEMAAINAKRVGLTQVTGAMNAEIGALLEQQAASTTATAQTQALADAQPALQQQIALDAETLEKLAKEFQKIMQDGATAFGNLVNTQATFLGQMEGAQSDHNGRMAKLQGDLEAAKTKEQKEGIQDRIKQENDAYDQSLKNAMKAYAEQAKAQRQALGEQLLAYIENQREMGNITDEKASEIRETTIKHFGIMRDSAAALFGEMAQSVDKFAQDSGKSTDQVEGDWSRLEGDAVSLQRKIEDATKERIAKITADFEAGKLTVDEAKKKLDEIPKEVRSEIIITTHHRDVYETGGYAENTPSGGGGKRASGGAVAAFTPYMVGETGRELFVPAIDGYVINAMDTRRLIAALSMRFSPPASAGQMMQSSSYTTNANRTLNMPVYTNMSPSAIQQSAAIANALL